MKKIIKIAIVCSFLFGIAPIFAEKSKVGFRYPRSFKAYIAEKYKDLKKTPTPVQINKPRYRVSAGSFPDKVETNTDTSTTKKFANPAYERSTRSQVQRAGIFCRFVENRTADSDCIKTINTNNPKKKHYQSSRNRFVGSTRPIVAKKTKKKSTNKRRTFSGGRGGSRQ